jgi:hypothetical protein
LQIRELIDFSRYVEPNSNPVGVATHSVRQGDGLGEPLPLGPHAGQLGFQ